MKLRRVKVGLEKVNLRDEATLIFKTLRESIVETWKQMREAEVQMLSGSLAFSTVMSIVPLLAVSLSVFHFYGGLESLMHQLEPFILHNLVAGSGDETRKFLQKSIQRVHSGTLGLGGAIGLLFASTKLFFDMEKAIQRVWKIDSRRPLWKRILVYWVILFLGPVLLAVVIGFIGSKDLGLFVLFPKWTLSFVVSLGSMLCLFKYVPDRHVGWRATIWSALIAASSVVFMQSVYAVMTKKILSYSKLYGSLAAIPIFLLWISILWWIFLGGVAMCAALQRRFELQRVSGC